MVRGASRLVGGLSGRFARIGGQPFWTPLRVVLAYLTGTLVLAWLQKSPCAVGPWTDGTQYLRMCYSDIISLYSVRGLADGAVPYLDGSFEYPVLTGAVAYLVALAVPVAGTAASAGTWYFALTSMVLAAAAAVTVWAVHELSGRRPWDAAAVALAPVMVLLAFVNWDLLAVALATSGLLAWSRRHPAWAGVLLGLATAAKLWPMLLLPFLGLLCLRAARIRPFLVALGAAVGTWVVVNLPVFVTNPSGWAEFYRLSRERVADWGTLWHLPDALGGPVREAVSPLLAGHGVNLFAGVTTAVALAAVAGLVLFARRRPRVGQVALLALAAFLLPGKVWSPQFALWLLPFAVMARPSWRTLLLWQAGEVLYFAAVWLHLYDVTTGSSAFPDVLFAVAATARMAAVVSLVVLVVRDALRPANDIVRTEGVDDPAGGPLDGAADAPWRRRLARRESALTMAD